jgi:hypothetical protein
VGDDNNSSLMPFAADCERRENGMAYISTIGNRRLTSQGLSPSPA